MRNYLTDTSVFDEVKTGGSGQTFLKMTDCYIIQKRLYHR